MNCELTIIGCRAGSPGGNSPASGYLLRVEDRYILVDCGSGVALRLAEKNLISRLSAVVITHAHADHTLDLVGLTYHRLFPGVQPRLPLYGPASVFETLDRLDQVYGIPTLPSLAKPLAQAFDYVPVRAGEGFSIEGLHFSSFRAGHPIETLALSIPGLVYTSDTSFSTELAQFAAGSSLLLAEATYPKSDGHDLDSHGHMTGGSAGKLARLAGVETLILTHFSDLSQAEETRQAASAEFAGKILIAEPGLTVPIGVDFAKDVAQRD